MSGPQGSDPNQPWQPHPPGQGEAQQPTDAGGQPGSAEATAAYPTDWQPPAYSPPMYPQYQQPPAEAYPATPQYPEPVSGYPQTGQYGQYPQQPGQYGQYPQQPGQFGQYPQQPGQYGQYPQQPGQYPQQPGQYGQPSSDERPKRSRALIVRVVGGLAALLVIVVLVLGFWVPGFLVTTKLDVDKAQTGVQQILSDQTSGYGAKNVKDVKCNNGQSPTVKKGDTFTCEVSIDGTKRQVTVTFQDNSGTYEVGRPS